MKFEILAAALAATHGALGLAVTPRGERTRGFFYPVVSQHLD